MALLEVNFRSVAGRQEHALFHMRQGCHILIALLQITLRYGKLLAHR